MLTIPVLSAYMGLFHTAPQIVQRYVLSQNEIMKDMQFSVEIRATRKKVWDTLWGNETFREWAGVIDPGTYMVGTLEEGREVQYISSENGYGVTSLVEKLTPGEFVLLRHSADTQGYGAQERKKEWTGGAESYSLSEKDGVTTLAVAFDVPIELVDLLGVSYPKALGRVKELAEAKAR